MGFTLEQINEGWDNVFANAKQLLTEAELLYSCGHFARSVTLAHIAREELAKITLLFNELRALAGDPQGLGWNDMARDHVTKIKIANLNMVTMYRALIQIQLQGGQVRASAEEMAHIDELLARAEQSAMKTEHDTRMNKEKNDRLYVGFQNGQFQSPAEVISEDLAKQTIEYSRLFFTLSKDLKDLVETARKVAALGNLSLIDLVRQMPTTPSEEASINRVTE